MTTLTNRIPTVEEAIAAVESPLYESYWWFTGLNFNRPVVCSVSVSVHITKGDKVRVYFQDETPVSGFTESHFKDRTFKMIGPIKLPDELATG